jgi:phage-related protein
VRAGGTSAARHLVKHTIDQAHMKMHMRIEDCARNGAVLLIGFLYPFMYIPIMPTNDKPLEWIGSSHKDLMALPADVRRLFGFALSLAQSGDKHDAAKVLKGFGGAGVLEVVEDDVGGTYRAVYTVKFAEAVFVLHCFQKKSKRGIATPKEDMDIIHARLKIAQAYAKELRK